MRMQSARTRCRAVWPLLLLVLGLAGIPAQTPGGEPGPINPQPIGSDRTTNPLVNEQGQNPYLRDGFCALPLPETDPDPVNLATGAFTFSQRDLQFAGIAGNDLVVARFHDSGALYDGPFGKQWDSPIFRRVFDWGPGTEAHVLNGELRDDVYAYGGSSGGVTSYQTPPGFYFQLVKATVGSTVEFRLADARGTVQTFEFNATIGGKDWYRLKETRDAHGNRLVFSYDAVRRLVAIGDTLGGTTTISYWPTGAKANRVRTITDPTGAATSYDYDSAGRLVRVRLPATPANPVADFVYGYDASGRLASVTEPGKSEPYLVNAYDGAGRLTSQQFGAPGQVSTVDYQSFPWVSIVDRGGALTECLVDPATHKILQKRQHLATPSSTVLVTTYTYDAAGHRVREVRPNGQVLEWDYDVANPDPRSRDNVLEYRRKASLADPLPLVTRWTWVPGSSRIATVMTPEALVQSGGIFDASRAIRFTYGPTGLLLSAQMPEVVTGAGTQSAATSFGYDALGRMITRIDADGLLSVFEYDPNVLRPHASVVRRDPNGLNETTSYEFDAANDVVRRLAACGCAGSAETRYVYDARRNLVEVRERIDAATERVASFAYDACGNLVQRRLQDDAEFGDGFATTTWSYDLLNNATHRVQDADASTTLVTAYGYDSKGRLARVDGPEGYARTFQYDERDLVVEERHVGSPATTADDIVSTFVYDGVGRLVDFTDPLGRHRTFSWDGYDRVLSDSDAASSVAFLGWDADGNLRSYRVEGPGNVVLDERNFDFDARHRLRRVDRRHVDAAGNAVGDGWLTVEYEHDPVGRVVAQRLESGTTATWSYDILGRTVSVRDGLVPPSGVDYEYFPDGFLKKVTVVEGNQLTGQVGTRIAAEFVAYDGLGRPLVVRDAAGRDTVREWGLADRVRAMIDRRGYRQEFGFDELGRKRREIRRMVLGGAPDPKDLVTTFDYDGLSRIIAVHAENGPTTATQTTAYAWDSQSRLTRITAADVSFETFTHDAAGNLVRYVDANGTVKTFSYDALDRLLGIDIQRASGVLGETFATFQRDALGRIVQAENDGYRVYRTWTSLGGLDTELVQEKNGTFTGTVRVLYGILGRVARVVYPAHTAAVPDYLDFVRDGIGRLISLDKREGAVTRRVLDFSYAGSRVVRRSSPTRTTDIGYDLLGEVNLVDHRVPSRPVARFEITRDAHGLVSDVLRTHYGPTGAPLPFGNQDGGAHYDYDGAERLTRSWSGLSAANLWAGNLGSAPLVKSYALDRNFNRTQVATAVAGSPLVRENYLVDLVNEYLRVGLKNVDYDDVGNTRTIQPGPGFAYDHAGRLVRITDGAATIDLGLDPFGRRLRTDLSATGTTERLSYLGWQPIEQRTTTGATTTRIEFHPTDTLDDVVEIRDATAGTVWQVFADQWGSPVALVGPGGQTAEMYRYDDFGLRRRVDPATGAALSGGAAALSPIGFQGRFTIGGDERWMDFRHRLYLPEWGRFASPDPLGYPDDLYNRYHFVGHNPNSKDPFGLNEDGHPADSPIAMTHVGETKAAAKGKLTDEDAWRVGYENWNQDNSPAVAGLGDADNAPNHAIGDEKTRRHWLEEHLTSITTDCSFENLGRVLHFVQDYVYHRDEHGNPYTNETWGHAKDSASGYFPGGFDPDNPPPPYDKMRNAESIAVSKIVIDLWLSWCGNQDAGGNYQPDYSQGGRPKDTPPPGPTTGGGKGPTTPGSSGPGAPGGAPGGTPSGPHTGPHTGNPGTPGGPGGAPGNGPGPTTGGPTTPKAPVPTPGPATGPATGPKTPGPATGPTTPGGGNGGPRTGPTTPGSAKAKILSELEKNTPKKPKKPKK